jgi:hypothetical protein
VGALAVLEVLDRDGQVRQSHPVQAWPLRLGRALDNDVVLSDPHVAAHHLRIDAADEGLELQVGNTVNGLGMGARHWKADARVPVAPAAGHLEFSIGRSRLRLRLAEAPLEAELPLGAAALGGHAQGPARGLTVAAGALVLGGLLFGTYLDTDPDLLGRALAGMAFAAIAAGLLWCALWALLSKTFTRQGRFGWHLKVLVLASLAMLVLEVVPKFLAFAFGWPAIESLAFIARYAVGAAAFYFHLLGIEIGRPAQVRWLTATAWLVAVGLALWFNLQRNDRWGEQLYLGHFFPPAFLLARPVEVEGFVNGLQPLQTVLNKKAKESPSGDSTGGSDEE